MWQTFKEKYLKSSIFISAYFIMLFVIISVEFDSGLLPQTKSTRYYKADKNNSEDARAIIIFLDSVVYQRNIKFPVFQELLEEKPDHSLFYKINVTWPTMTIPKMKAMMTGNQKFTPTSIIKSFFARKSKDENIITELQEKGHRVITMGSNIWQGVFSADNLYHCTKQFDIWDYQTCDNLVYDHLEEHLKDSKNKMIINHISALDRMGHNSKKSQSTEMDQTMIKISDFIKKIIPQMKKHDYLFVIGDHGMSTYGSHGSFSAEQSRTFLFVHSPNNKINPILKKGDEMLHSDMSTTLALLYNIRIPKNSVGMPLFYSENMVESQQDKIKLTKSIQKTTFEQYFQVIKFAGITCPKMYEKKSQNVSYELLKELRQTCIQAILDIHPNQAKVTICVIIMIVILILSILSLDIHFVYGFFILFVGYYYTYSWSTQHKLTSFYLICFVIITLSLIKVNIVRKVGILGIILIISQFQRVWKGDYFSPGLLSNQLTRNIFQSFSSQFVVSTLLFTLVFVYAFRKNKNQNNVSQKISKKFLYILFPVLLISQYVKIYTQEKMKGQENRRLPVIACNYLVTIVLVGFLIHRIYQKYNSSNLSNFFSENISNIQILLLSYLSIINNQYYWIFVVSYYVITRKLLKAEGCLSGVISFILSVYIWCLFGYRYQQSGFLIDQSFVYSTLFNQFWSPIFLFFNVFTSILIAWIIQLETDNRQSEKHFQVVEQQNQFSQRQISDKQQLKVQEQKVKLQQKEQKNVYLIDINYLKGFLLIPMAVLIFCFFRLSKVTDSMTYLVYYVTLILIVGGQMLVTGLTIVTLSLISLIKKHL